MSDAATNPELSTGTQPQIESEDRPFYPVAAAIVAAGIGVLVLGILTTLGEASEGIKNFLQFSDTVGPLSGTTILAVLSWAITWPVLHAIYRKNEPTVKAVAWTTGILIGLGVLLTFPTFFEAFAPEE